MTRILQKALPFLRWFPISKENFRADILAGVAAVLVLFSQTMAYAKLTTSALAPLVVTRSEQFVALAVMLALLLGLIQQAGDENLFGSRDIALQTLQARLPGD